MTHYRLPEESRYLQQWLVSTIGLDHRAILRSDHYRRQLHHRSNRRSSRSCLRHRSNHHQRFQPDAGTSCPARDAMGSLIASTGHTAHVVLLNRWMLLACTRIYVVPSTPPLRSTNKNPSRICRQQRVKSSGSSYDADAHTPHTKSTTKSCLKSHAIVADREIQTMCQPPLPSLCSVPC